MIIIYLCVCMFFCLKSRFYFFSFLSVYYVLVFIFCFKDIMENNLIFNFENLIVYYYGNE